MITPLAPTTADVLGVDLYAGSVVVRPDGPHTIASLAEYPGRFFGDHARVAYYADGGEATVADRQHYHCLPEWSTR